MFTKIKKWIKSLYYNYRYNGNTHYVKKQSHLEKDIVLGLLQLRKARHIKVGVKVKTQEGIANIKELIANNWIRVSYINSRFRNNVEHKVYHLFQYFVQVEDRRKGGYKIFRLSYSDYEYIHPDEDNNVWLEGFITNSKYFKLTDEVKEDRKAIPIFNKCSGGVKILEKLKDENIDVIIKTKNHERSY